MSVSGLDFLLQRINYERRTTLPYDSQRMKLSNMRALLDLLGNPQEDVPIIHVAGTKGKGSVTAILASILTASGYRVGTYTSPHLRDLTERFCINGEQCSQENLLNLVERIRPVVERLDEQFESGASDINPPTFFEITTAIGFQYFADQKADFAVIETGLGGRLDSTNVCSPVLSVITTISFDHTKQLGNTLAKIAGEKAGIIKPIVPVVSGVTQPEPRDVIRDVAKERGSALFELDREFRIENVQLQQQHEANEAVGDSFRFPTPAAFDFRFASASQTDRKSQHETPFGNEQAFGNVALPDLKNVRCGLVGSHQQRNAALAIASAIVLAGQQNSANAITAETIHEGIASAAMPGRIELISQSPTVICDVAHNPASAQALIDTIGDSLRHFSAGRSRLIYATSRDKDFRRVLQVLLPFFDEVCFTQFQENPRSRDPQELLHCAKEIASEQDADASRTPKPMSAIDNPIDAWNQVREESMEQDVICIMGSAFIVAELRDVAIGKPV